MKDSHMLKTFSELYESAEEVLFIIGLYSAISNTLDDVLFIHAFQNAIVASLLMTEYILVRMLKDFLSANPDVNGDKENLFVLAIFN